MTTKKTEIIENVKEEIMNEPVEYSAGFTKLMTKLSKEIRTELGKIESSFTKVAFNLYKMDEDKLYITAGYKNITDMAKHEFNIKKQTCYNFINVVSRFGERLPDGTVGNKISADFKDFKSSQLIAMIGLTDEEMKEINADMSVRDIKKLGTEESSESPTTVSENEDIEVEATSINRQAIITISTIEEYDNREDFIYQQIVNALKDPKHKVEISYIW